MAQSVLVAYASKYGATAEIANKIGDVLNEAGIHADVKSVESAIDVSRYDAFVVGGSVYIGRMRKAARNFLKRHAGLLATKPVWLFASGTTDDKPADPRMAGFENPTSTKETIQRIAPRDTKVFAGCIDPAKASGLDKWVINKVGAKIADARDWDDISSWAQSVARELT
jgi:menaquinone-dependent protoporphyrinogen oxidase